MGTIIRYSEVQSYLDCPRKYKLESESPRRLGHQALGGQAMSLACDRFHKGLDFKLDPVQIFDAALTASASTGEYTCGARERDVILDRGSSAFSEYRLWFTRSGMSVVSSELEMRAFVGSNEIGGKADLLATKDGKFYLLDIKCHTMFGDSVSLPKHSKESMRRNLQLAMYAYMLKSGCLISGKMGRHESIKDIDKRRVIPVSGGVDKIGIIEMAFLVPYVRGTKDAKPGDLRGDPMVTMDMEAANISYCEETVRYFVNSSIMSGFPRVPRRMFGGKDGCDSCQFLNRCFPGWDRNQLEKPDWMEQ